MARINLLPWRADRRKQREREFYMMLAASAVAAVIVFFGATYWMSQRIEAQNNRNAYLTKEIKDLDVKIEKIKDLERTRSQLLARKEIIEDLQSNRSQMVHLFDQLAKTIPDGTRLTSLKQANDVLTLEGVAESSTRVATYMRNLEKSPQMGRSDLGKIESKEGTAGADKKMPYLFAMSVRVNKPAEEGTGEATDGEAVMPSSSSTTPGAPDPATSSSTPLANAASTSTTQPAPATAPATKPAVAPATPAEEKKP